MMSKFFIYRSGKLVAVVHAKVGIEAITKARYMTGSTADLGAYRAEQVVVRERCRSRRVMTESRELGPQPRGFEPLPGEGGVHGLVSILEYVPLLSQRGCQGCVEHVGVVQGRH